VETNRRSKVCFSLVQHKVIVIIILIKVIKCTDLGSWCSQTSQIKWQTVPRPKQSVYKFSLEIRNNSRYENANVSTRSAYSSLWGNIQMHELPLHAWLRLTSWPSAPQYHLQAQRFSDPILVPCVCACVCVCVCVCVRVCVRLKCLGEMEHQRSFA